MGINKFRQARRDLEASIQQEISNKVAEFREKTGLDVTNIYLSRVDLHTVSEEFPTYDPTVSVEVRV